MQAYILDLFNQAAKPLAFRAWSGKQAARTRPQATLVFHIICIADRSGTSRPHPRGIERTTKR